MKQVGKSEHKIILVVLTHSCYHIKENLPKEVGFYQDIQYPLQKRASFLTAEQPLYTKPLPRKRY